MGLLDLLWGGKNRNEKAETNKNAGRYASEYDDSEVTKRDIERLRIHAKEMEKILINRATSRQGVQIREALMYASGLAGYACHNTVKQISPNAFVVVEMKNGKKFYYGDAPNHFLLENKYSILSWCVSAYQYSYQDRSLPDVNQIIATVAEHIGDETFQIWGEWDASRAYSEIRNCYQQIYETMTAKYCKNVKEEPVLFGIVLQDIMVRLMPVANGDEIFTFALQNACYISKMDEESI